ncbi:MAG: beta-galactosidase [Chloroflexota bacterium]|nr:beta-galactosidase [Chloroflexota bacterium]
MFHFGVDYYPEHWPEARWPVDAAMMAEAGFNVVRLAELAWSLMEPDDGRFEFDWLDRAIAILAAEKIQVILGTPTASPPPWLIASSPDILRTTADGQRVGYGSRRNTCPSHQGYLAYSRRVAQQMAAHFAGNSVVIGWQIDNEFGDPCYCATCRQAFQTWLQARYGSLDELNERWGTRFWSHVYSSWSEIPVPLTTSYSHNPGLALDFKRYSSDAYVLYQQEQIDAIRERCPDQFISHNLMGFGYDRLDYFDLARPLDMVSWDNYPRGFWKEVFPDDPSRMALGHDTMRGLKKGPFWMMEQQSGASGWARSTLEPVRSSRRPV